MIDWDLRYHSGLDLFFYGMSIALSVSFVLLHRSGYLEPPGQSFPYLPSINH